MSCTAYVVILSIVSKNKKSFFEMQKSLSCIFWGAFQSFKFGKIENPSKENEANFHAPETVKKKIFNTAGVDL